MKPQTKEDPEDPPTPQRPTHRHNRLSSATAAPEWFCEMSFKFDFSPSPLTSDDGQHTRSTDGDDDTSQAANALVASYTRRTAQKECTIVDARLDDVDLDTFETIDLQTQGIEGLKFTTTCHTRGPAYLKSHDVVPGVYEGGLKVWECSIDMCRYLASALGEAQEHGSSMESDPVRTALSRALGSGGSALELVRLRPHCSCRSRVDF